jgi:hypothetical protein
MRYLFCRLLVGAVALFLITQTSFAQVKNRLELGAGGMKSAEYVDFLVKVSNRLTIGEESGEEDFFIIVKVSADAAMNSKLLSYLDFSFEVAPSVDLYDDEQTRIYLGYNLVSFKHQKNIDIDQAYQYQLSVVGFRAGGHHEFDESKIKLFGQVSVDLLSVVFDAKRASDGVALSGKEYGKRQSSGINAFMGVDIKERVRIVLGGELMKTKALGYEVATGGETCTDYYDDFGDYLYSDCVSNSEFVYDESWMSGKLYAEATVNITKSLSVFGRASYNVFRMNDVTEYFPSSSNAQWQFMLGAKYNLFSATKN